MASQVNFFCYKNLLLVKQGSSPLKNDVEVQHNYNEPSVKKIEYHDEDCVDESPKKKGKNKIFAVKNQFGKISNENTPIADIKRRGGNDNGEYTLKLKSHSKNQVTNEVTTTNLDGKQKSKYNQQKHHEHQPNRLTSLNNVDSQPDTNLRQFYSNRIAKKDEFQTQLQNANNQNDDNLINDIRKNNPSIALESQSQPSKANNLATKITCPYCYKKVHIEDNLDVGNPNNTNNEKVQSRNSRPAKISNLERADMIPKDENNNTTQKNTHVKNDQ